MKDQASIVVIGGGIYGVNIAYHLAKLGFTDLILLEKQDISSGATAHAAGLVTQFATSETMMTFRKYSIELYSELGLFEHVGSLRLASSAEQFKELQRSVSRAKAIGMDVEVISPSEAVRIMPQLTSESLYGAIYLPHDGHLDPYTTTTSMAKLVKEMGATILTGVKVTGIELSPKGEVTQVITTHGAIRTENVINAAGIWAPRVAAMAGVYMPSTPIDHQHIALKAVPGNEFMRETPCLRDPDNLVYMREEARGLVIGGYEPNPLARWVDGVPWDHDGTALPGSLDRFEVLMEGAIRRIPFLERAEIITLVCHPGAYTPDCQPLLGPVPGIKGFWMAAGMSLNGFGGAGGMGKLLAEWIAGEWPSKDIYAFRPERFGNYYSNPYYSVEKTRESVKYYYRLRFPNDENEWGRPYRLSPLHFRLEDYGAVFGEKYGWERVNYFQPGKAWRRAGADQRAWGWSKPPYFERVGREHLAVRERVGIFDLTSFGKIEVSAPGALPLLQKLADSDLDQPVGSVVYTQFLNPVGGVEADITITRLGEERFRIITGSSFVSNDLGWLQKHVPSSENSVDIKDVTLDYACIALWGPKARLVLEKVTDADISNEAYPYMHAKEISVQGVPVFTQRVSYVGELGWEIYVLVRNAVQIWDDLIEAGEEYGIEVGGYKAIDSLRLEKGYRYFTADVTPLETPYEAGLGFCVDLDKGDFVGRDALLAVKDRGPRRKLCTLVIEGEDFLPIYGGEAIYSKGRVVSRIRSGGYGYSLRKNIIYAYLTPELSKAGNLFELDIFDQRCQAEVTRTVLLDPKGERIKS